MKTHITEEQLNSLTEKQTRAAQKYWSQSPSQSFTPAFFNLTEMICLLNTYDNNSLAHVLDILLFNSSAEVETIIVTVDADKLCDGLWEAVVEVFEDGVI